MEASARWELFCGLCGAFYGESVESASALESRGLAAIVLFYKVGLFAERFLNGLDEFLATLRKTAHGNDSVAFGVVVRDGEGLAVRFQSIGGAFDEIIGRLAFFGVKHLEAVRRDRLGGIGWRAAAVKDDGKWCSDGVPVLGKLADEFLTGGSRVPGLTGRQLLPSMQETVAINEYANDCHVRSIVWR